jgi:3-hydroxybutyryl-CoA dehydrogenase
MDAKQIRNVLVLGAGTMGQQIALLCAWHGYRVSLYDLGTEILDRALARIRGLAQQLVAEEYLAPDEVEQILDRITPSTDATEAAREADLVSESIPEDPKLKGQVLGQFDKLCPPHTLFTTNSSTLVPSQYAEATGRPAQFCALHFHQPIWTANVVDIMPHPATDPSVVAVLRDFARDLDQIPIYLGKESPGYVFNAMLNGILRAALELASSEIATVQDIDRSWMGVTNMEMGPFGMIDLVGIDLVHSIVLRDAGVFRFLPRARRILSFLGSYVDQGKLGIKSGQGFYTYPNPAFKQQDFIEGS